MAAILQIKGPVVTPQVPKSSWRFLNMMKTDQFEKAARELETLNLGTLVNLKPSGMRGMVVFVKKPPQEVIAALRENEDLCPLDYYEQRYYAPVSKIVKLRVRSELLQMGILSAKQLQ